MAELAQRRCFFALSRSDNFIARLVLQSRTSRICQKWQLKIAYSENNDQEEEARSIQDTTSKMLCLIGMYLYYVCKDVNVCFNKLKKNVNLIG